MDSSEMWVSSLQAAIVEWLNTSQRSLYVSEWTGLPGDEV